MYHFAICIARLWNYSTGSSEPEVRRRIGLAKSCLNLLNRGIWHSIITFCTKVQLYRTYIQSVLLYGSEIWAITWALQEKVDAFDNICLHCIFRNPHAIHGPHNQCHHTTPSLLTSAAVLTHPDQTASILWTRGKDGYITCDITRALKVSIRGLPRDWRRPPGRPLHTWVCTLDAYIQPHNLGLNSAWKYAQNREHWKHFMETATLQLGHAHDDDDMYRQLLVSLYCIIKSEA